MNAADLANMPAFPTLDTSEVPASDDRGNAWKEVTQHYSVGGQTLRQYYAGKFMAALLSCPETNDTAEGFAESAVIYADLLIAELANPTTGGAA